jgi:hypothetical protein
MSTLRYPFLVVLSLAFSLLAYVLAPLLPLFAAPVLGPTDNNTATSVEPRLPTWLNWFMTPDNSLYGDQTFKGNHPPSYWSQVLWLWRNPAYGFDLLLGVAPWQPVRESPVIGDGSGAEGWRCYTTPGAFSFLWVKRLWGTRCTHFEFGWKFDTGALVFSPRFSTLHL